MIDIGRLATTFGEPLSQVRAPGDSAYRSLDAREAALPEVGALHRDMPAPMAGYAQLWRTAEQPDHLWRRLVVVAVQHDGYLDRFVYDPMPPAPTEALPPLAGRPPQMQLPSWLIEVAASSDIAPNQLLSIAPNPVFWNLVSNLRKNGGTIVMPSAEHIPLPDPARDAVLQYLSHGRQRITVLFADPCNAASPLSVERAAPNSGGRTARPFTDSTGSSSHLPSTGLHEVSQPWE
ncbi:hypothetical protein [Nocardia alni]|uniref:hypothetical protein n=1 Tax=Nocardia alni TaxID=2815723 RepID=UPI001C246FAD|nr:hypothetical protein [Nocardia alni]